MAWIGPVARRWPRREVKFGTDLNFRSHVTETALDTANWSHMKRLFIAALMLLVTAVLPVSLVRADGLKILCEDSAPWCLLGAGQRPTGYAVEIVQEIQKRVHNHDPIHIQPWARIYATITNQSGVVVFTMARTKARAPLFQWVGPIVEDGWVLVAKKSAKLKVGSLDEARKLSAIGTIRGYSNDQFLTSQGFTNLDQTNDSAHNVKKMAADRFPVFASFVHSYQTELTQAGQKADDYEVVLRFGTTQMYIAHSKANDSAMVQAWQAAFDGMLADGTVARLLKKWVPDAKVPEPAAPEM